MKLPPLPLGTSPLDTAQTTAFNALASSLNAQQAAWLSGYLAGITQTQIGTAPPAVAPGASEPLTILYGSQTGNAEKLAKKARERAEARGISAKIMSMADCKAAALKKVKQLMVVVSTHGEGDPPDTAVEFYEFILGKRAPKLEGVKFTVLGLGDSSYEHFCKMGVVFDARLAELGGERVGKRVDCDVDYEDAADEWIACSLDVFASMAGTNGTGHSVVTLSAPAAPSAYSKKHPFPAEVLERINLNGRGSDKETWHVELALEGSGLTYEPGDALGILPRNNPRYVEELLKAGAWSGGEMIETHEGPLGLQAALEKLYEITTLTRPSLKSFAEKVGSSSLLPLFDDARKAELSAYLEGREWIDVLIEHPGLGFSPVDFIALLRKMPPRLYSIASSLGAHPDEVHLTIGATRYVSRGRAREGVCSTYVADRIEVGDHLMVYVDSNPNFKLPSDDDAPMIMIGPGTGIAPFRAFVEEREARGAAGRNWLFFGDQHFTTDFLYQTEWQRQLKQGVLTRLDVAFSRDQTEKVYVQHRMREQAAELYRWIQDGAHIYVCGDAKRMAHDVNSELLAILVAQGGVSAEEAANTLKDLTAARRYQRDVY